MSCLVRLCGRLPTPSAPPSPTISPALARRSGRSDRCADGGWSRTSSPTSRRQRAWVRCAGLPASWVHASTSTCTTTDVWASIAARLPPRLSSGFGGSSPAPGRRPVPLWHGLVRWSCTPKTSGVPSRSRTRPRSRPSARSPASMPGGTSPGSAAAPSRACASRRPTGPSQPALARWSAGRRWR